MINHILCIVQDTVLLACGYIEATYFNVFQDATQLNSVGMQTQRLLPGCMNAKSKDDSQQQTIKEQKNTFMQ
jgi:hypothetical protein